MKNGLFLVLLALLANLVFADVTIVYPVKEVVKAGALVEVGSVSRGETFDLAFSRASGRGFVWDELVMDSASLPPLWRASKAMVNDASLVTKITVPVDAVQGSYKINSVLVNEADNAREEVGVALEVKENLLDVSFARETNSEVVIGDEVIYKAVITNASIAPETVRLSTNLPSSWVQGKTIEMKPNSTGEMAFVVKPLTSGNQDFSFTAYSVQKDTIVKTFSSELKVKPTLKGKLAAMFSGFPFFTFSLLPFQLFASYLSLLFL